MSPLPIQDPNLSQNLAEALGIKGRIQLQVDEQVVPIAIMESFGPGSPYRSAIPCSVSRSQGGGGAGVFSAVMVRPATGKILVVERIVMVEVNGAITKYRSTVLSPANVAAVTIVSTAQFLNGNSPRRTAAAIQEVASLGDAMTHTAILGDLHSRMNALADEQTDIVIPGGYALYGNDPAGVSGFAVWNEAANTTSRGTIFCTEYGLKG